MMRIPLAVAILLLPAAALAQTVPTIGQTGMGPNGQPATSRADIAAAIGAKLDQTGPGSALMVQPAGSLLATSLAALSARRGLVPDDFYQPADGTDDTPSINRTITAACAAGLAVRFEARTYAMRSPVNGFCGGTRLIGSGWTDTQAGALVETTLADYNTSTTVSAISVQSVPSVTIQDIAFTEPNQPLPNASAVAAWTPVAMAPVITMFASNGSYLRHLLFNGVYQGIYADLSGRLTVDDIDGQAFNGLVSIHHSYDSDHINYIHDWSGYWSSNSNVVAYTEAHETTLLVGRQDTAVIGDIFSIGSNIGMAFSADASGTSYNGVSVPAASAPAGVSTADHIHTISCDGTVNCVVVAGSGVVADIDEIRTQAQNYGQSFPPSNGAVAGFVGASAIYVTATGWANYLHVKDVVTYQVQVPISMQNTSLCSLLVIDALFSDYQYAGSSPALVSAAQCNGTASYNQIQLTWWNNQNATGTATVEPAGNTRGVSVVRPTTTTTY